ncbi:hypothetical protein [Actinomadura flavalba]|uniref:hypothetical protein n=1 Tax=Actinomadura flavalba TaxID=1120938 RepID=UPI0003A1A7E8|nr:hypothetical protein [Actinomadura flavalba]
MFASSQGTGSFVESGYLVASAVAPPEVAGRRGGLGGGAVAALAGRLLGTPSLVVEAREAPPDVPWLGRSSLRDVLRDEHYTFVGGTCGSERQPEHARAVRLVARVLAHRTHGRVADLATCRILTQPTPPPESGTPGTPSTGTGAFGLSPAEVDVVGVSPTGAGSVAAAGRVLGAGTIGTPSGGSAFGVVPSEEGVFVARDGWTAVFIDRDGDGRVRAETRGLHRFGLPELVTRAVPYGSMLTAANLLRGLTHRLLTDRLAGRAIPRPSGDGPQHHPFDPDDVLRFWGARPHHPGVTLALHLVPTPTPCALPVCRALEVLPSSSRGDTTWWETRAAPVIQPIVGHR